MHGLSLLRAWKKTERIIKKKQQKTTAKIAKTKRKTTATTEKK